MNNTIIGICGFKRSGKSTVATMLMNSVSLKEFPQIMIRGFADSVKQEVADLLGTTVLDLENKKNHPLIRHIYQWYGTEYGRKELGEDVWIKKMEEWMKVVANVPTANRTLFIIPDVRFPNEAQWIKKQGGVLLRVEKGGHFPEDPHESEAYAYKLAVDFTISNNQSLERLRHEVKCIKALVWEQLKLHTT